MRSPGAISCVSETKIDTMLLLGAKGRSSSGAESVRRGGCGPTDDSRPLSLSLSLMPCRLSRCSIKSLSAPRHSRQSPLYFDRQAPPFATFRQEARSLRKKGTKSKLRNGREADSISKRAAPIKLFFFLFFFRPLLFHQFPNSSLTGQPGAQDGAPVHGLGSRGTDDERRAAARGGRGGAGREARGGGDCECHFFGRERERTRGGEGRKELEENEKSTRSACSPLPLPQQRERLGSFRFPPPPS